MPPNDRPTVEELRQRHEAAKRQSAGLIRELRRELCRPLVAEILRRRGWGNLPEN